MDQLGPGSVFVTADATDQKMDQSGPVKISLTEEGRSRAAAVREHPILLARCSAARRVAQRSEGLDFAEKVKRGLDRVYGKDPRP